MNPCGRISWVVFIVALGIRATCPLRMSAAPPAAVGTVQPASSGLPAPGWTEVAPAPRPLETVTSTRPGIDMPPAMRGCPSADRVLQGPIYTEGHAPPNMAPAQVQEGDTPLPINLPTALKLADARPLIIAAAQAGLQQSVAQWQRSRVLWLPNINLGASYLGHAGGSAGQAGPEFINDRNLLLLGGGVTAIFAITDATFSPLAARQVVRAREAELQASRNDALELVAEAYFNVQQARGRVSGILDAREKARSLVETVRQLSKDLTAPIEVDRARTLQADIERQVELLYQDWRVNSADLTRELRLNPLTVVVPQEPPFLQLTLISPREQVDGLVAIGLTYRPELAANQALVQATLVRLRMEKLRPLIPSVILAGNPVPVAPYGELMGGAFYSDFNGHQNPWSGRIDPNVQVFWTLQNFGFGNRALVRERQADNQRALVELFRVQDRVASDVVQAHARVQSASVRMTRAETELKEALVTYAGNLKAITETTRFGNRLVLVNRPLEAVDSLRQVVRGYENYFVSTGDYNRAQFQLYRALGYPSRIIACERMGGEMMPVDTTTATDLSPRQLHP